MTESDPTAQLRACVATPIAELNPELQDAEKRVVRGEVTVFWPYSPLRDVVAFLLAEHDFRLRRERGTVRVELTGASAKAIVELGLGGGDEVTISLDGVAWTARDARMPVIGTPLEWQLSFSNKLLAQITLVASNDTKLLNVDQSPGEAHQSTTPKLAALPAIFEDDAPERAITPPRDPTPEPALRAKRPAEGSLEPGEFASPAFLKRARMSYGSLFEGGADIFEDEGGAKGRGKKKSKTGRFSSSWRYASRSPTPELQEADNEVTSDDQMVGDTTETPSKHTPMVDGGCQTDELNFTPPYHVDVIAEPHIQSPRTFDTPNVPSGPLLHTNPSSMGGLAEMDRGSQGDEDANTNPADSLHEYQDDPEDNFGAQTYSERRFQPSNVQSYTTSRSGPISSEIGDDEDEMDAGGDYDITQYRNQSNVQDDDEGSDLESDFGQEEEEEIYNTRDSEHSELEEEQLDEDVEEDFEEEGDYSEEESPAALAPTKPNGPPEVIDLLSDSDDDDSSPVQRASAGVVQSPLPQFNGSADEMGSPSGEEVAEQSDASEDKTSSSDSEVAPEQAESEIESEAGDEEDQSSPLLVEVPDNLPEPKEEPAASSPLLEDDLESMSPIKPLQVKSLTQDEDDASSEGGTSDAAQLDAELESEIQQTIEDASPILEDRPSNILVVEETSLLEMVESGAPQPYVNYMMDTGPVESAPDAVRDGDTKMEDQASSPMNFAPSSPLKKANGKEKEELATTTEATDAEALPFFSARAILDHPDVAQRLDDLKATSTVPSPIDGQGFNLHADTIAKTSGIDHSLSRPLGRDGQHVSPPNTSFQVPSESPQQNMLVHSRDPAEGDMEEKPLETERIHTRSSPSDSGNRQSPLQQAKADADPEDSDREDVIMSDELKGDSEAVKVAHAPEVDEPDTVMEDADVQLPTPVDTQQQELTKQEEVEQSSDVMSPLAIPSVVVSESRADDETILDDSQKNPDAPPSSTEEPAQGGKTNSPVAIGHRPETRSQTGHLPPDAENSSLVVTESDKDAQLEADQDHTPTKDISHRPETRSQSRPQSLEPRAFSPQTAVASTPASQKAQAEETPAAKTRSQRKRSQSKTKADEDDEDDPIIKLARASAASKQKADQGDDPSVRLARGSIASRRSTRLSDRQPTPDTVRVTRAACHNLQKEATPEAEEDSSLQLAKDALNSPSRAAKERAEEHSPAAIKLKLNRSLRSEVPDCISLKVLRQQPPGKTVDIMAIATAEPPSAKRAKGGPKGMMLAFSIADHSIVPTQPALVHIFRVQKSALPIVHQGDAVLLRQFNVTNIQGKLGLRSTDASSWAVFEGAPDDERPPQIMGPPMELSAGDKAYAVLIKKWYHSIEEAPRVRWSKAGEKALGAGEESK
ncbi:hypothetical protein ACHAQH_006720 [Verticillium albo-atrum]